MKALKTPPFVIPTEGQLQGRIGGNHYLNFSVEDFNEFRALAMRVIVQFNRELQDEVYSEVYNWGWSKALIDYNVGRCSKTFFYPTIISGGEVKGNLTHCKIVSELGYDNIAEIVEDEDRYVKENCGEYLRLLDHPNDKTMIIMGWKPTEKQKLKVKMEGWKGYLRPFRHKGWFVEPIIIANFEDEIQFKDKLMMILRRMLTRFYGKRWVKLIEALDIPPLLHNYDPDKLLNTIYNKLYNVYRSPVEDFLKLLCKLISWLKNGIVKHIHKAKETFNLREYIKKTFNIPAKLASSIARKIVDNLSSHIQTIKEEEIKGKIEAEILNGKYIIPSKPIDRSYIKMPRVKVT